MTHRIAIIKPSALGDIVHALPVLSALRSRFPDAHISWIINKSFESLIKNHPQLNATFPFERNAFRKSILNAMHYSWQFANELRQHRFDLVIDLQGLLRTGLMCAATGAPRKIGFANAREGAVHFYSETVSVPDANQIHAVDRYWRIVEYLGGSGPKQFQVPVSSEEIAAAQLTLRDYPRPWLAVAVGARWATKRWPAASFGTLIAKAQRNFGGTAVYLGTADDRMDSLKAAVTLPGPWLDLTGATSLPRLAAVLSLSDAMIANDTGPLHLAAALRVPCVAPYTCTKTALHGPYGQHGGVETSVDCAGSYLKKCPHGLKCFMELTPARLWPALEGVLSQWRVRRSA